MRQPVPMGAGEGVCVWGRSRFRERYVKRGSGMSGTGVRRPVSVRRWSLLLLLLVVVGVWAALWVPVRWAAAADSRVSWPVALVGEHGVVVAAEGTESVGDGGSSARRAPLLVTALVDGTVRAFEVPSGRQLWRVNTNGTRQCDDGAQVVSPGEEARATATAAPMEAPTTPASAAVPSPNPTPLVRDEGGARAVAATYPAIPVHRRETRALTVSLRDGQVLRRFAYDNDVSHGVCQWAPTPATACTPSDASPKRLATDDVGATSHHNSPSPPRADEILVITRTDSGLQLMDPVSGARNWNAQYAEYDMYLMDDAERGLQNTMRRHGQQWGPMEGAAVASANEPATVVKEDAGRIGAYPGTLRAAPTYEAVLSSDSRSIAVRNCRSGRVVWRALLPSAVLAVKGIGDLALSMEDPGALADVGGSQALLPAGADAAVPATLSGAAAGMRGASVPSVAEEVCVPGSSDLYDVLQPQRRGNAYTPLSGRTPDSAPVEGSGLLLLALFLLALGAAAAGFVLWTMHRFRPNIRYWPGRIATADTSLRARDTHTQSMDAAVATETELSRETAVKRKHRKKGRLKAVADATAPAPLSPSLQLGVGADADVPPGYTRIGRLLLSSVILGLGSHGTTVFEGLLLPGRRRVAIKRLLRSFYKIARREIGVLIELDESCQHILRYYAMEEGGEFIYVALELCDGSLEDRVQRRLPPSTVCPPYRNMDAALVAAVSVERAVDGIADDPRQHHDHVAADAARPCGPPRTTVRALHGLLLGLTELHDHGIVHRDLKPANVLLALGTDDVVKIGDVGLAKRLDRGRDSFTAHDTMAGTVGWRPPEVLRHSGQSRVGVPDATTAASSSSSSSGVPAADMPPDAEPPSRLTKAIDVFSAGCVAFYLLTGGLHPFGQLLFERDANILSGTVDVGALRSWPEAYDWVMSMLQHAPERRPPVAYLLAHPFFWSRAKRLQFLTDVSDVIFEGVGYRHLRGELDRDANALILGSNHNWTLFIDTCVLLSLRGRSYSGSSVMDLLRLMRNKRVHFREQSEEVRRVLGTLPVEDEQGMDGEVVMKRVESAFGEHVFTEAMPGRPVRSHDLYSYFAERFPNLFMYVYAFVIRTGLAGDPHFARYGLQEALAFHQQWRQARGGGGEEAALFSAPWYPRSGGGGGGGGGGESWLSAEWATPGNVAKANSPAALAASLSTLSATSQASALGGNHASRGSGAHGGDGGALHESHPLWLSSSTTTCSSSPSPRAADLSVSTGGFVPVHHRRSPRRREPERGWDDGKEAVEATASTSSPARHVYSAEQFRALRGRGTADVADPRGPFLSCSLPLSLLAHPSPVWELPRRTAVGNADAAGMFSPGTPPSASMTHRT